METDDKQDQEKEQVANEEPMETDNNVDEEQQQQPLDTVTQVNSALGAKPGMAHLEIICPIFQACLAVKIRRNLPFLTILAYIWFVITSLVFFNLGNFYFEGFFNLKKIRQCLTFSVPIFFRDGC